MSLNALFRASLNTLFRASLNTLFRLSLNTWFRASLNTLFRVSLNTLLRPQNIDRRPLSVLAALGLVWATAFALTILSQWSSEWNIPRSVSGVYMGCATLTVLWNMLTITTKAEL